MLDLFNLVPLRCWLFVPVLAVVAWFLREKIGMRGRGLIFLLFTLACVVGVVYRQKTSPYTGWLYWVDIIFFYGLFNSLRLTFYAVGYNSVRVSAYAGRRRRRKHMMKRTWLKAILTLFSVTVYASVLSLLFGAGPADTFLRLSDIWFGTALGLIIFTLITNVFTFPERLTWKYWVVLASLLLGVSAYFTASTTPSRTLCIVSLILFMVFNLTAILTSLIPYLAKRNKEGEYPELDEALYSTTWAKIRVRLPQMKDKKKISLLSNFLLFKLVGDDINNGIDFSRPFFTMTKEDGGVRYLTLNGAMSEGASAEDLALASAYLQSLIKGGN